MLAGGSGNLVVSIDGVQALDTTVALPASALVEASDINLRY